MNPGTKAMLLAALASLPFVGCTPSSADNASDDLTESPYQFVEAKNWQMVDALGVPLTSTALANRDDAYNDKAPYGDGVVEKAILFTFRKYLSRMHRWAFANEQLEFDADGDGEKDFTACSDEIGSCGKDDDACVTAVVPCTLQKISTDGVAPRTVLDVVLPDHLTIDVTETPAFPNGRPIYRLGDDGSMIYEQINDLVIAMGFLKMGADCPGDPTGICNLHSFANMKHADGSVGMNKQENDKAFERNFPYLATPHGVEERDGYWPEYGDE